MAEAPSVDETLTPDDAVDVLEELLPAQNKSYELGLKLKLQQHDVEAIHSNELSPEKCLLKVLIKFLQQTEPIPTWRVIVESLKSPAVGLPALAKKVEANHFPDPPTTHNVAPETTATDSTGGDDGEVVFPSQSRNEKDIRDEIMQLDKQFYNIKIATREHLEKQNVPVKRVVDALTSLVTYEGEIHHKLFLRDNVKDLLGADDHSEVFVLMNFHWDYLNYHLLEVVIERFDIAEVKEEMNSYKLDLQHFREKTTLKQFCNAHKRKPRKPQGFCELVAEFNWPNNEDVTLQVVEDFRKKYADHYSLQDFAMMLKEVRHGSFIVTWLVSKSIIGMLYVKVPEELLIKFFITKLVVDETVVYDMYQSKQTLYSGNGSYYISPASSESGYCSPKPKLIRNTDMQWEEAGEQQEQAANGSLRDCREYKYTGKCGKHSIGECPFQHDVKLRESESRREYLMIPPGITPGMVVGVGGCNVRKLGRIAECYVKVDKKKVLIITDREDKMKLLADAMKLILSQEPVSGPSWCYIHPQGLSGHTKYQFRPYRGRTPVRAQFPRLKIYELCQDSRQIGRSEEDDIVEALAAFSPFTPDDTKKGLQSKLKQLHGDTEGAAENLTWKQRTRIDPKPKEKILEHLAYGLEVLRGKREHEKFITRLDARFGKVTWTKFPENVYSNKYDIQDLVKLLFAKNSKHINIFNTDVRRASASAVKTCFGDRTSYALETFDVKVTTIKDIKSRLDVRLLVKRSDNGMNSCKVLLVKMNEIKDVTLDVQNLHRKHDVRIGLHHYKCVEEEEPLYEVVREMVGRIAFPSRHRVRIQPRTSRWSVHLIRHKQKTTYIMDGGFAVTVATLSEHSFDTVKDEAVEFDMRMEAKETHAEVELHNLAWECAFGRDAGFSPDKSLALHMERGSVDTREFDTVPHPWEAASILADFDTFWGHLETLTGTLDGPQ